MILQSGYGQKGKIRDARMLTLRLQWCQLTARESNRLGNEILQMARDVFGGQEMLYDGDSNSCLCRTRLCKHLWWHLKEDFYMALNGYVRTDEKKRVQRNRIIDEFFLNKKVSFDPREASKHPLYADSVSKAIDLLNNVYTKNETDYSTDQFPTETKFCVVRRYSGKMRYYLEVRISVSAYAIGYALSELMEKYKEYIQYFSKESCLYAGYLYYETSSCGAYQYYHSPTYNKWGIFASDKYLLGYEWAAYLSTDIVQRLTSEELAELEQHATISQEENGLYYQANCDITAFGLEEKKVFYNIFKRLLRKGANWVPLNRIYIDKVQPVLQTVYLMNNKGEVVEPEKLPYFVGFSNEVKFEDTNILEYFDVVEKVDLKME